MDGTWRRLGMAAVLVALFAACDGGASGGDTIVGPEQDTQAPDTATADPDTLAPAAETLEPVPDTADPATGAWLPAAANGVDDDGDGTTDAPGELARAFFAAKGVQLSSVYFGELHGHTRYSIDAAACGKPAPLQPTPAPWDAYTFARDTARLDFVGLSDHDYEPNVRAVPDADDPEYGACTASSDTSADPLWASTPCIAKKFDEDGRFVVFAGWEYTNTHGAPCVGGSLVGYGHKNVVLKPLDAEELPAARYSASCAMADVYAATATDLWAALDAYRPEPPATVGRALTIIHTPANVGNEAGGGHGEIFTPELAACDCDVPEGHVMNALDHSVDWDVVDEDFTRHVEIISKWGCSEGPVPTGLASTPDPDFEYASDPESDPLTVRAQLHRRWVEDGDERYALGFVGGTDGHDGHPGGDAIDVCDMHHRGGITGVVATARTRDAIWDGLWARHTIASSTGARHLTLLFGVEADEPLLMGDVGTFSGPIEVRAYGEPADHDQYGRVDRLSLIVDGAVILETEGTTLEGTLTLTPGERHYVYVRGEAADDDARAGDEHARRVWSSPVYLKPAE